MADRCISSVVCWQFGPRFGLKGKVKVYSWRNNNVFTSFRFLRMRLWFFFCLHCVALDKSTEFNITSSSLHPVSYRQSVLASFDRNQVLSWTLIKYFCLPQTNDHELYELFCKANSLVVAQVSGCKTGNRVKTRINTTAAVAAQYCCTGINA